MHLIGKEEALIEMFPPPEQLGQLTNGIIKAVAESFKRETMRNPTQDEVRKRFEICVKWAKVFRGDLKWGIVRICDEFREVLKAELVGAKYEPPKRQCWIPSDGNAF